MPAGTLDTTTSQPAGATTAAAALLAIADDLTTAGFSARSPAWNGSAYLAITNARGALCDLTITATGTLTWDYRSHHGSHVEPGQITGIVLNLLSPGTGQPAAAPPPCPAASLKGTVGQALAARGLRVTLNLLDQDHERYETYAEIQITNPASPARGTVRVTDDGDLTWSCTTRQAGGITPADIAATLTRALTQAQHTPCHA